MTKSELVGYVRKSNTGNALKLNILKSALDEAKTVEGKDGTQYVSLIMNLSKIKMIIGDEHEVTSICQLIDENEPGKSKDLPSTPKDETECSLDPSDWSNQQTFEIAQYIETVSEMKSDIMLEIEGRKTRMGFGFEDEIAAMIEVEIKTRTNLSTDNVNWVELAECYME